MVKASQIASALGLNVVGNDIEVKGYSQLAGIQPFTLVFAKKFKDEMLETLNGHSDILAIVTADYEGKLGCPHIVSPNPRLDFIKTISRFFAPDPPRAGIHPTAVVEEGAVIGNGVTIGANCFVSARCKIGDHTWLHANVVLDNMVTVGEHCEIKSGVVVGQSGFGFERDADGQPVYFPHTGGVVIGDHVYIGANTCIDRGTMGNTYIDDYVKIDNLVHISHNCHLERGTFVVSGAFLGGGTHTGENCWLAANITVKEQTRINDRALVGLGAVVLKEVDEGAVMIGNPARKLEKKQGK